MQVQKVHLGSDRYSYTVLGDDYLPIEPIHQFIIYLENLDRSPYTIRSYAYHLKLFWQYLEKLNVSWKAIKLDTLTNFIHWLKLGESNKVIKLYPNESKRQNTSINSILASIIAFYQFHERLGNIEALFGESSVSVGGPRRFKPLLHHISKHKPYQRQLIKMKEPDFVPKTLNKDQIKLMAIRWYLAYALSYRNIEELMAERNATLLGIELHHMLRKGQHKAAANIAVYEQFYSLAA